MAASKTEICNLALANASLTGGVQNIDTEPTAEAARCRQWYDFTRKSILSSFDWSFARKHIKLVPHTQPASDDDSVHFSVRYEYPLDCIALRELRPFDINGRQYPFRVEVTDDGSRSLLTGIESASIRYTFDQTNSRLFSPAFDIALSLGVAAYIVEPTTGKSSRRHTLLQEAYIALRQAAEVDFNSEQDPPERDAEWIQVRNNYQVGSGYYGPNNVFVEIQNLEAATGRSFSPGD